YPTTITELRSFLGFASVFRRYIKRFASVAFPLTSLLRKAPAKTCTVFLDELAKTAFLKLKKAITSPPILAYFVPSAKTIVETDASYTGIGACFFQEQDGRKVVIEYASRSLHDAETRYHSNELECVAVHCAITVKLRIYSDGIRFTLLTDNYTTAY